MRERESCRQNQIQIDRHRESNNIEESRKNEKKRIREGERTSA